MGYVELHAASAFSFLRGGSFPEHLAQTAAELEMPALALLDRDGLYGAQRFSVAAREHNVRPIIGCELTMEDGVSLPVLVEDRTGYKNLCELLTQTHLRSEKGTCPISRNELPQFAEGLVVFLGGARALACPVRRLAERNGSRGRVSGEGAGNSTRGACAPQSLADRAQILIGAFGRENVFVEI